MKRHREGGRLKLQRTLSDEMNEEDIDTILTDAGIDIDVPLEEKRSICSALLESGDGDGKKKQKEEATTKPEKRTVLDDDKEETSVQSKTSSRKTRNLLTLHSRKGFQGEKSDVNASTTSSDPLSPGQKPKNVAVIVPDMDTCETQPPLRKVRRRRKPLCNVKGMDLKESLKADSATEEEVDRDMNPILALNTEVQRSPILSSSSSHSSERVIPESQFGSSQGGSVEGDNRGCSPSKIKVWPPRFSPSCIKDPAVYTEVIKLMFDIYIQRLRAAKYKRIAKEQWGKPVFCGSRLNNSLRRDPTEIVDRANTDSRPKRYSTRAAQRHFLNNAMDEDNTMANEYEIEDAEVVHTRSISVNKDKAHSVRGTRLDDDLEEDIEGNVSPDSKPDFVLTTDHYSSNQYSSENGDSDYNPNPNRQKKNLIPSKTQRKGFSKAGKRKKMSSLQEQNPKKKPIIHDDYEPEIISVSKEPLQKRNKVTRRLDKVEIEDAEIVHTRSISVNKDKAHSVRGTRQEDDQEEDIEGNVSPDSKPDFVLTTDNYSPNQYSSENGDSDYNTNPNRHKKNLNASKMQRKGCSKAGKRKEMSSSQEQNSQKKSVIHDDFEPEIISVSKEPFQKWNKVTRGLDKVEECDVGLCKDKINDAKPNHGTVDGWIKINSSKKRKVEPPSIRECRSNDETDKDIIIRSTDLPDIEIMQCDVLHDSANENKYFGKNLPTRQIYRKDSPKYGKKQVLPNKSVGKFDDPVVGSRRLNFSEAREEMRLDSAEMKETDISGEHKKRRRYNGETSWLSKETDFDLGSGLQDEDSTVGSRRRNRKNNTNSCPEKKTAANRKKINNNTLEFTFTSKEVSVLADFNSTAKDMPSCLGVGETSSGESRKSGKSSIREKDPDSPVIDVDSSPEEGLGVGKLISRVNAAAVESEAVPSSQSSGFLLDSNGDMYCTQIERAGMKSLSSTGNNSISRQYKPAADTDRTGEACENNLNKKKSYMDKGDVAIDSGNVADKFQERPRTRRKGKSRANLESDFGRAGDNLQDAVDIVDEEEEKRDNGVDTRLHRHQRKSQDLQSEEVDSPMSFDKKKKKQRMDTELDNAGGSREKRWMQKEKNAGEEMHANNTDVIEVVEEELVSLEKGTCPICRNEFPTKDLEAHASSCSDYFVEQESKANCLICKEEYPIDQLKKHQASCAESHGGRETRKRSKTKAEVTVRKGSTAIRSRRNLGAPEESPESSGDDFGDLIVEPETKK